MFGWWRRAAARASTRKRSRSVELAWRDERDELDRHRAIENTILRQEDLPADEIEMLGPTGASRIDSLVKDIVRQSTDADEIMQSEHMGMAMLRLRKFMFDNVYLGGEARKDHDRVHGVIRALFEHYLQRIDELPPLDPEADSIQRVTDLLAGMTDRYCIADYTAIYVPEGSRF